MPPLLVSLLTLLLIHTLHVQSCIDHEREALLKFKAGVTDPNNQLASWSGGACCNWAGIGCNNQSGHVVHLDLRNRNYTGGYSYVNHRLSGKVSPFLAAPSNLEYLDLSCNNFSGELPVFIGSFEKLKYLNLSKNFHLSGKMPPQIGNLSRLQYLDLSSNPKLMTQADISWLSHLQSLRHLDMSSVELYGSKEWAQSLNKVPTLEVLVLDFNNLADIPHSLSSVNFSSLRALTLSNQNFNTTIPNWIFNLTSLTTLDLSFSYFVGPIPEALGKLNSLSKLVLGYNPLDGKIPPLYNLTKLNYLDFSNIPIGDHINVTDIPKSFSHQTWRRMKGLVLSDCSLTGTLKGWIDQASSLKYLHTSDNNLTGLILNDIGNLTNIIELDFYDNSFTGSLTDAHLYQLSKVEVLNLDNNPISIAIKDNWRPSFSLRSLSLLSCKVGPIFPAWLRNQLNIETLDLSNTQIDDILPHWLWNLKSLSFLDISRNRIRGQMPESMAHLSKLISMDLSDNQFEGTVSSFFPDNLYLLDLSNNRFQRLPKTLEASGLLDFYLSNNSLSGNIESSLCILTSLIMLDFSSNNLSGYLPNSLPSSLEVLLLENNKISGNIPRSLCNPTSQLSQIRVMNNNLTGSFPTALKFCTRLRSIDLGDNHFHGEVLEWVGESFPFIESLSLRSNVFSGSILSKLTSLSKLRILDLANNQFSGQIPAYLDNLIMMRNQNSGEDDYDESWSATLKNIDVEYNTNGFSLEYFKSMDLSNNNLTGEIPETIIALDGLMNLNLSGNHLTGKIPVEIGMMKYLESLDLRMNNLSGKIPESMSALNFLEVFNVSYNNLSGSIPTGPQLQSLDEPSIYMGNAYLCGPPLPTSCNVNGNYTDGTNNSNSNGSGDDKEKLWLYLLIEIGFVIGFLVAVFILLFKRNWRYAYFQWVDSMADKLYVSGALLSKKLRKKKG